LWDLNASKHTPRCFGGRRPWPRLRSPLSRRVASLTFPTRAPCCRRLTGGDLISDHPLLPAALVGMASVPVRPSLTGGSSERTLPARRSRACRCRPRRKDSGVSPCQKCQGTRDCYYSNNCLINRSNRPGQQQVEHFCTGDYKESSQQKKRGAMHCLLVTTTDTL